MTWEMVKISPEDYSEHVGKSIDLATPVGR